MINKLLLSAFLALIGSGLSALYISTVHAADVVPPEIEMPGHSKAALAAYPELTCTGRKFDVPTRFGIFKDIYCAGKE